MLKIIGPGEKLDILKDISAGRSPAAVDVLIVNALAESEELAFDDIQDAKLDKTCIEDVVECFSQIAEISPQLAQGSRIVFLVPCAFLGGAVAAHQATLSAMLVGLARSLTLELADRHITVNCVAVGQQLDSEGMREAMAFLLAEGSANMTGQIIVLDNGENLRLRNRRPRKLDPNGPQISEIWRD